MRSCRKRALTFTAVLRSNHCLPYVQKGVRAETDEVYVFTHYAQED